MNLRDKYIQTKSEYIFESYFNKKYLTARYNQVFGKYHLQKMKAAYSIFNIDKKIENRFALSYLLNVSKDLDSISADVYADAIFKQEYMELENRIKTLKFKMDNSKDELKKFDQIFKENPIQKISQILSKIDPIINSAEAGKEVYEAFKKDLDRGYIDILDRYLAKSEEIGYKSKRNSQETYKGEIEAYKKSLEELKSKFPFNQEKNLADDKLKSETIKDLEEDIKKSEDALKKLTRMYLLTGENGGLLN